MKISKEKSLCENKVYDVAKMDKKRTFFFKNPHYIFQRICSNK